MNMKNRPEVKPAQARIRTLEDSLPIQLLKIHNQVMTYFRPMLNRFGMTDQQWRVMRAIAAGVTDFGDLAQATHIQPASLSRMLVNLQDKGWTARSVTDTDRRQRTVSMTPKGWAQFRAASEETEKIHTRLEQDLGADYTTLIDMIAGVSNRLGSLQEAAPKDD